MWKHACVSVRGSGHKTNGLPCQDHSTIALAGAMHDALVCAIADGAGSAKFADEGAKLVTGIGIEYFLNQLTDHPHPDHLISTYGRSDGEALVHALQMKLRAHAKERNAGVEDFSATLLLAIIHQHASFFFQVGDGCWVTSRAGVLGAVTWPIHGEYVGQTDFITTDRASESFQVASFLGSIDFAVGISDGLERLALDIQGCVPHRGFFDPLARGLIATRDMDAFKAQLENFLDSERVCDRTDDDKTLVIVAPDEPRS